MKKILLTVIFALSYIGLSWSQVINKYEGVGFYGISANGKWTYSVDVESGRIFVLDIENDDLIIHQGDPLAPYIDDVSNNGYFAGSYMGKAAIMDKDGQWQYLPLPKDLQINSSSARGISADASAICGYIEINDGNNSRLPTLWELQSDGKYTCLILPYPEKDFSQLMPQASDALRVSGDGSVIAGRLIDWSGMYCLVLVWEKKDNGEWEYRLLGEKILFNEGVELPFFDPDTRPEFPDPTDYFTEEDWERYNAAIKQWEEDVANDPENYYLYENPVYNQEKYITDRRDEYDAAYAIYVTLATEYNAALDAYYEALDRYLTGNIIDVYFMNLSDNGRYLTITMQADNEDADMWNPEPHYIPMYFDLKTGESKIFDFEKGALAMTTTNDGSLYYSTPNMSMMRNSFVIPAGAEDHSIDLQTWILEKTDYFVDLSEHFYYHWREFDPYTFQEVDKEGTITGSVLVSANGNILLSTFESPETFEAISYVVNLGTETAIKATDAVSGINIYPNPVEETLNISGEFTEFTLMNMNGTNLLQSTENGANVSHLPSGMYILKIELSGQAPVVKKIIKK